MATESPVTAQDIEALNRASVERTAVITRFAGAVLVGVGALGLLGWFWLTVRAQQRTEQFAFSFDDLNSNSPSLQTRVDVFTSTLSLLIVSATLVGVGLALRLAADYAQTRVGGSVTGFQVGDAFPTDDDEGDADD